jgi:DNA-binding transcriptional regulator YdaS (Cro superfamily)
MSTEITPEARRRLAESTGVSEPYLYQCLTGRRDMNPAEAMRLETETGGELRRWALCQKTWHRIWPDLIEAEGAPEPSAPLTKQTA